MQRGNPVDEEICSTLSSTLQMCGQHRRAAKLFETAVTHSPNAVPLLRELFFVYAALREYKQQQLVRRWFDLTH